MPEKFNEIKRQMEELFAEMNRVADEKQFNDFIRQNIEYLNSDTKRLLSFINELVNFCERN